jgi:hypothetical protein
MSMLQLQDDRSTRLGLCLRHVVRDVVAGDAGQSGSDTHRRSDPPAPDVWRRDVHAILAPGLSEFGEAIVWNETRMDARRSFEQLFNRITDAARRWAANVPRKPTEAVVPPAQPVRLLAKPEPIPADSAEHAIQFAQDWYDRLELQARRRMRELGIAEHRIGAYDIDYDFRHAALHPKERTGGSNFPGAHQP